MPRCFLAIPHEGAVKVSWPKIQVIAAGKSPITGRRFNIAVAFEPSEAGGPAIAQSTFTLPITIVTRPPAPRASSASR